MTSVFEIVVNSMHQSEVKRYIMLNTANPSTCITGIQNILGSPTFMNLVGQMNIKFKHEQIYMLSTR